MKLYAIFSRGRARKLPIRLTQYPPLVGIMCISYLKLKPVHRSVNGDSALKFIIAYRLLISETLGICEFLNGSLLLFKSFYFTYKQCLFMEALTLFQTEFTFETAFLPVLCMLYVSFFLISQPQQHKSKHKNTIKAEKKGSLTSHKPM